MEPSDTSKDFFLRLNDGRQSGFAELDRRFRQRLCALVERELGSRFLAREDAEDPVQSALASFCHGVREKRFQIDHSGKLWALLAKITRHKLLNHIAHHATQGRDPACERPLAEDRLLSQEPTPEDAARVVDLIERVVQGLEPPAPEMFRLRLQGYARAEIAARFGLTEGAVRCKLDRIRDRLQKVLDEERESDR